MVTWTAARTEQTADLPRFRFHIFILCCYAVVHGRRGTWLSLDRRSIVSSRRNRSLASFHRTTTRCSCAQQSCAWFPSLHTDSATATRHNAPQFRRHAAGTCGLVTPLPQALALPTFSPRLCRTEDACSALRCVRNTSVTMETTRYMNSPVACPSGTLAV